METAASRWLLRGVVVLAISCSAQSLLAQSALAQSALAQSGNAPARFEHRWSGARELFLAGRLDEAEVSLRRLTAEEPSRVGPWVDLLDLLMFRDRSIEAEPVARRLYSLAPWHPDIALFDAGRAARRGDVSAALRVLREARRRDPTPALRLAERAVRHRLDPLFVLSAPHARAQRWLTSLDDAAAARETGHLLGVLGGLAGLGAIATVIVELVASLSCAFGGCTRDSTGAIVLGSTLAASSVGLLIGSGVAHGTARGLRHSVFDEQPRFGSSR